LDAILARGHGGRLASLKTDDIEALKAGLRQGGWKTAVQIRKWLEELGISMTVWGVYYWLKKVKAKNKVPRKTHKDQNPEELADFKANIVDKLNSLEIPKGLRICVWVQDEHRYGLISNIRRCWTLRGHRVKVPFQMKYTWSYVYGTVEINTGKALFMYIPTVSLQWSLVFLEQIVATDREAIHVVIWDQAGFHHKPVATDVPSEIRLLPLPPYCPELNPMEKLWDRVKGHVGNKVFETLQSIEAEITDVLEPFWSKVERVFALLGDNWLTRGVQTFISQRACAESAG
jgi:transposase